MWVLGHSYIHWAAQSASYHQGGTNLGLGKLEVVAISKISPGPIVLVIHAGGNDLCYTRVSELLSLIQSDMESFKAFFHYLILV